MDLAMELFETPRPSYSTKWSPYKRFYPGAQGEIGEGRKEIGGELGAGSELPAGIGF
jgi:hypothetical protein